MVVEPETVLTTHVSHLMNKFAGELLGQDDVQALLDNLSASAPSQSSLLYRTDPLAFAYEYLARITGWADAN